MIRTALDGAGGAEYLQKCAIEEPKAFLSLVGRLVPSEIRADLKGDALTVLVRDLSGLNREEVESNGHTSKADDAQSNGAGDQAG
jgi:hypothetical protein